MHPNKECNTVIKLTNLYFVKRIVPHVKENPIVCYYCCIFMPTNTWTVEIQFIQSIWISRRLKEPKHLPKNNEGSCTDRELVKK